MSFRLYIVPSIGTGTSKDARRPKYVGAGEALDGHDNPSWKDYGREGQFVVGADYSTSDDNFLIAQPDCMALPIDLSPTLTAGQVTTVKNALDAINIPGQWVSTSDTWLSVVRTVLGIFEFMARYEAVYAAQTGLPGVSIFTAGITLNSTFGSLPQAVQDALLGTADSFGIDRSGVTGATTVRVMLKQVAAFFSTRVYNFNGTTF